MSSQHMEQPITTTPNTDDGPHQSFPFLRLPKELRLIVYESLFASITRTYHASQSMSTSPQARHPCLLQKSGKPAASILFIHEALTVAVLVTCRLIYSEARVIAQSALRALQQRPKKMIITTCAIDTSILDIFIHLSHSTDDFHRITQIDSRVVNWNVGAMKVPQPARQATQVQVAILNDFEKMPFGDHGTTEDLWSYLRMYMLRLHYDKLLYEAQDFRSRGQWRPCRNLDVTFRMALMSPTEKEEFEAEQWLNRSIMFNGRYSLQIQGGDQLETDEWEKDWAAPTATSEHAVNRIIEDRAAILPAPTRLVSLTQGVKSVLTRGRRKSRSKFNKLFQATSEKWKSVCRRWSARG